LIEGGNDRSSTICLNNFRWLNLAADSTAERDAKLAILYFFYKASKTFQAIYVLRSRGFDQDGIILNRTLLEILLQADWIHHDPENAKRFQDHAAASSYAVYELMIKLSDATFPEAGEMASALAADPHFADKRSRYDEFTVKYGKVPMNWWGDNLRELLKKLCTSGKRRQVLLRRIFLLLQNGKRARPLYGSMGRGLRGEER
jgi:hypothetical protein